MHINFKKVILHNFLSFGHSSLDFDDSGFIRVTGINENPEDHAISNGSGKSSLWEAIVWALTGDTIRGTKHIANIHGEDGTYVELDFDVDSSHYNILRSKDHKEYKTNIRIIIDGKDCSGKGIRDSEKLLTQYLPDITASLVGSVIILGQGLPQKFTNNSPSGRKEVLEKLSKSDFMIEDLKSRVTKRKMDLHKMIRELEDSILASNTTKDYLSEQIKSSQEALESLDGSDLQRQLKDIQTELAVYEADRAAVVEEFESVHHILDEQKNELYKLNDELEELRLSIQEEYKSQISEAEFNSSRLNAERSSKSREIIRIENIKDVCPTCGQHLPDVHKPDTSMLKAELAQLDTDYAAAEHIRITLTNERDEKLNQIVNEYSQKKSDINASIRDLSTSVDQYGKRVKEVDLKISVATSKSTELQRLIAQLETTIQNYRKTIETNSVKIQELDNQLMYNNNERDLQQTHLDVINKFETALKRDFRGFLLSTIIEYIQQRAKIYSAVIFETDKVGFSLDGNNIDITYLGKAYENLSGGEKQKIDLIIQFSIRDMLCNHIGFTSNILVLDEVFDGLDMIGCQRVLDVISNIEDIKNIFIVTHRKDLSIPTDKEIVVVKSIAGISEIH